MTLTLARKGTNVAFKDKIRGEEAILGQRRSAYFDSPMYGEASYFKCKKSGELLLAGVWVYLDDTYVNGGSVTLNFHLYEVENVLSPGVVDTGAKLKFIQTGEGYRNVPAPGPRLLFGGFKSVSLEANKSYAIRVTLDVDRTIGVWKLAQVVAIDPQVTTAYVGASNVYSSNVIPSADPTYPYQVGANTTVNYFIATNILMTDLNDLTITGMGWKCIGGQNFDYRGTIWSVLQSSPTYVNQSTAFTINVILTAPGAIWFSRVVNVKTTADGEPGDSKLSFYINNELKAEWVGSQVWQVIDDKFFLKAGSYTFKWEFTELDKDYANSAAIGQIVVEQYDLMPFDVTEYKPPRSLTKMTTHETLQGFNRYQRMGPQGTQIEFTLIIHDGADYIDFMRKMDTLFVFIDEQNLIYGGIIDLEIEPKKIGAKSTYYIPVKMRCNQITGFGA